MDPPDSTSAAEQRRLLVIEILDFQSTVSNENASAFHFQNLAEDNSLAFPSADAQFTPTTPSSLGLPPAEMTTTPGIYYSAGTGHQRVKQDNTTAPKWLRIDLCVIRLPHVQTDILVTLSAPSTDESSNNPSQQQGATSQLREHKQSSSCFHEIISSLRIHDWGLFNADHTSQ
jgi:Ran-interacting Mog1 protein